MKYRVKVRKGGHKTCYQATGKSSISRSHYFYIVNVYEKNNAAGTAGK